MADINTERRAVIEWFKSGFSKEAGSTTKIERLQDGSLSYKFSVTNNSGLDFDSFKFKVKVIDRDSGAEIGTASINAGEWNRGDRKNFKSRLNIPANVRNISFVMFAESIEYEARGAYGMHDALREMTDAAKGMGEALGKAGEGMGTVLGELFSNGGMPGNEGATVKKTTTTKNTTTTMRGPAGSAGAGNAKSAGASAPNRSGVRPQSYASKKLEKKLNNMRMGKSGWIVAAFIAAALFGIATLEAAFGGNMTDLVSSGALAIACAGAGAYLKVSLGNKSKRIRTYETRVNRKGNTSIDDLAAELGRKPEKVADDLHKMILDGFFPDAYVDMENRLLVMTENGQPIEDVARSAAMNKKAKRKAAREGGVVPESIDDLITMTDDREVKDKLKALRTITKKIDERVEQVPELEKQVTDFREKYYPEVVRLTDEYNEKIVDMGKYGEENVKEEVTQSAEGAPVLNTNPNYLQEQAAEIKSQLVSLIDSVTEASENLLEKLHEDDIMDITTDIRMLQTTLASKGLLDSDFEVKK